MAEKKLFDNLYKVIKVNSGGITANDTIVTEIMDLQIPRGYCARVRRVKFALRTLNDQVTGNPHYHVLTALVLDADDENSVAIPTFEVDHDVLVDHRFEMWMELQTNGLTSIWAPSVVYDFDEEMDVVTVRNIRANSLVNGMTVNGSDPPQTETTVYFTYEKISADLYAKLLGIS